MDKKKETDSLLPYEKPTLRTIQLAAEEVLVTKCKAAPATQIRSYQGCGAISCNQYGAS